MADQVREFYSADVRIRLDVESQVIHVSKTDDETITVGRCTKIAATLVTSVDGQETRRPVAFFIPQRIPYVEKSCQHG